MSRRGMLGRLIGLSLATILSACASGPPNVELLNRSTVLVEHAKGHGTGTIVGPHAVLTAYHVVQESPLEVTFFAGPSEARLYGFACEKRAGRWRIALDLDIRAVR